MMIPHRHISQIDIREVDHGRIEIDVVGTAFLRNMVRILVGTLVGVGEQRWPAEQVAAILQSRDRVQAGVTAPAQGLCLEQVFY